MYMLRNMKDSVSQTKFIYFTIIMLIFLFFVTTVHALSDETMVNIPSKQTDFNGDDPCYNYTTCLDVCYVNHRPDCQRDCCVINGKGCDKCPQ